jgi:ferredoxin
VNYDAATEKRKLFRAMASAGLLPFAGHCSDLDDDEQAVLRELLEDRVLEGDGVGVEDPGILAELTAKMIRRRRGELAAVPLEIPADILATMQERWASVVRTIAMRLHNVSELALAQHLGFRNVRVKAGACDGCPACRAADGTLFKVANAQEAWATAHRIEPEAARRLMRALSVEDAQRAWHGHAVDFFPVPPWHRGCACRLVAEGQGRTLSMEPR